MQAIIRGKIDAAALVNTDGWRGHDGLVDAGVDRHFRVRPGRDEFVQGAPRINGTASFWSFAKARLLPFKGVPKHPFLLHLKGSGFRFNLRYEDRYKLLLKLLRQQPLSLGLLPTAPSFLFIQILDGPVGGAGSSASPRPQVTETPGLQRGRSGV